MSFYKNIGECDEMKYARDIVSSYDRDIERCKYKSKHYYTSGPIIKGSKYDLDGNTIDEVEIEYLDLKDKESIIKQVCDYINDGYTFVTKERRELFDKILNVSDKIARNSFYGSANYVSVNGKTAKTFYDAYAQYTQEYEGNLYTNNK